MHIVQCYELEEKSVEGQFEGVLRKTSTIGLWALEVTSKQTSLFRLAEVVSGIIKPEYRAFESLDIQELQCSFKNEPVVFKKGEDGKTILEKLARIVQCE